MKRLLLCSVVLLALAPPARAAGQIHLSVDDCGAHGASEINNACTSNVGSIVLVGSTIPPVTIPQFVAFEGLILFDQQVTISDWWRTDAAGCRAGRMIDSFDFAAGPFNCTDFWSNRGSGGVFTFYPYYPHVFYPPQPLPPVYSPGGGVGLDIHCAIVDAQAAPIDPDHEYYLFKIAITFDKTVSGCSGCGEPTTITFFDVLLEQPQGGPGANVEFVGDGIGQTVMYNGGVVPNHRPSWGQIKALYH